MTSTMNKDKLMKDLLALVNDGKVDEAVELIENGGKIDDAAENGGKVDDASENGGKCFVELDKVIHNKSADTLIHHLAKLGVHQVIEAVLKRGKEIDINIRNFDGKTALHDACQQGHIQTVKLLVHHGAKVNTLKKADWSPAMLAVTHSGRIELLKFLVDSGADLSLTNKDGWTAFQIASRSGDLEVLKYILTILPDAWCNISKNGRNCLHTASLAGNCQTVQLLLEIGANPNSSDSCGNTPFMDAIRSGCSDTLQVFLSEKRLNAGTGDKLGRNAVHVAAEAGQLKALKTLNEIGLSLESLTANGQTPLHSAAREGQSETVEYLVKQNVDLDHRDENGRTALFLSVSGQHLETSKILLKAGAKLVPDNLNTKLTTLARKQPLRDLLIQHQASSTTP